MPTLVVVGAQWGDEGKGKVVDVLASKADIVARFAGGNNAGHTLVVEGKQIITHLVPSGCTYPGTICALGSGMVIDPVVFREEVESLQALGLLQNNELRVSLGAHLIFERGGRCLQGLICLPQFEALLFQQALGFRPGARFARDARSQTVPIEFRHGP